MKNRIEEITERVKKPIMEILSKEGIGNIDLYSGLKMAIRDWDKIHNRWLKLRDNFIEKGGYTQEMIQKVVALNDGLYERFKMVYQDVCDMHKKIEQEISTGQLKISGYCIYPEFFFAYNYDDEGIPTADGDMLALMSDYTFFPTYFGLDASNRMYDKHKSFEDFFAYYDPHDGKNCSLLFDRYEDNEELNKYKIHYFMHEIFLESHTFCVADIPYLKPEDLKWQIKVEYEKLGEPLQPLKNVRDLSKEALDALVANNGGSCAYLMRHLAISYEEASKVMDNLESSGCIRKTANNLEYEVIKTLI